MAVCNNWEEVRGGPGKIISQINTIWVRECQVQLESIQMLSCGPTHVVTFGRNHKLISDRSTGI